MAGEGVGHAPEAEGMPTEDQTIDSPDKAAEGVAETSPTAQAIVPPVGAFLQGSGGGGGSVRERSPAPESARLKRLLVDTESRLATLVSENRGTLDREAAATTQAAEAAREAEQVCVC